MTKFERISANSREEWLENRKGAIGGSDAACVVGMNPWRSSDDLFDELMGITIPEDISEKPAVRYGTLAEAPLRELFALDYPDMTVEHFENQTLQSKQHEFMKASLDGELTEIDTGRRGVLEIKTTTVRSARDLKGWKDMIPQNYFVQVLHNLNVTGYDFAILRVHLKKMWTTDSEVRDYRFEVSDLIEDLEYLLQAESAFWDYVKQGKRPPLVLPAI